MKNLIESLPLPPVFYRPEPTPFYFREDVDGRWMKVDTTTVRSFVSEHGYESGCAEGTSEVNRCLLRLQSEQNVAYAAPLAGHRAGLHIINGNRVLVTESPRFIEPVPGEWPMIDGLLKAMFDDDPHHQRDYLLGWWKQAVEAVRSGQVTASQMLTLAGPPGSGKSLTQELITATLGGRSAKPYLSMCGRTDFNADLFRAEHLVIDDEAENITIEKRRHFAASIKAICVNPEQHCHGKNKDGLTLTPVWRLSCSVNDDPERLQVLPPLDNDVADKIIILKVKAGAMPMPSGTPAARAAFWARLVGELPHFLAYLRSWEIPAELRADRYGMRHYHHPEVVEVLVNGAPEVRLQGLIDADYFRYPADLAGTCQREPWDAKAEEIERHLQRDDGPVARQAGQLLRHHSHCGTYLGRLYKHQAGELGRISRRLVNGDTVWTIQPPPLPPRAPASHRQVGPPRDEEPVPVYVPPR